MSAAARKRIERVVVERVVKTFGATAALRRIDAAFERGRLNLIEGPNGSGKTTLLRILGSAMRPTSGRVRYEPLGEDPMEVRREVGWVSHEALAYGDLSGRENVLLAARFHGLDGDALWDAVRERFDLGRFAERPLRTNSRGQKQRVALARALVHDPSLILLDEPTTGLDREGVERLVDLVSGLIDDGAVVAIVTHEPHVFDSIDTARLRLERGRVKA